MRQQGQVGVEYLSITAFLLAAVGIIFVVALATYYDASTTFASKQAVEALVNGADQVSGLGNGSVLFVDVTFPNDVKTVFVNPLYAKELVLTVGSTFGDKNFYTDATAFLEWTPSNTFNPGKHVYCVKSVDGNIVFSEFTGAMC